MSNRCMKLNSASYEESDHQVSARDATVLVENIHTCTLDGVLQLQGIEPSVPCSVCFLAVIEALRLWFF